MRHSLEKIMDLAGSYDPAKKPDRWDSEWAAVQRLMADGWKLKQSVDFLVSVGAIPKSQSVKAWNALRRRHATRNANLGGKTDMERELARVNAELSRIKDYLMSLKIRYPN